ncbi:hypothetical protein P261_02584 [Lachnospiraceae bacterium TWA4]|nr:hypothetical protein P261_02584 [Lachnospiraceae bacterium TWA4]
MRASERFTEITNQTGLYNIQAIDNIPSIMKRGLLSNERAKIINHVSIAMNEVQQKRDFIKIPNGLKLHQYANLYFDPWNPMLSLKRNQNQQICILKFDRAVLDMNNVIVSDRNASSAYAAFYTPEIGLENIEFDIVYARYWIDEDHYQQLRKKSIKCAEVLVPYAIPYDFVVCAAVVNKQAAVKLKDIGFDKKIIVEPRVFFKEVNQ